jgi:Tfp pilus assembly protein PilZ
MMVETDLSAINPDDIESMSVLKGNTAAALYGAKSGQWSDPHNHQNPVKARKGMGIQFNSNITTDKAIDRTDFQNQYGQGIDGKKPTTQMDALDNSSFGMGSKI